jgi:hypothetical protein
MSTRANIHFNYSTGETVANVYRHSDGYPEGVLPDLDRFFSDVEAQTDDTRFNDPSYLAAKFVVWQAGENARMMVYGLPGAMVKPLNFLSVGIMNQDAGDAQYVYDVTTAEGQDSRPTVTHREAR